MKKTIILSFLLIFGFWSIANLVSAQEATQEATFASQEIQAIVAADEVTTKDLGVEEPGILPSSPFYFLKNWGRGVQRVFTFDPTNRAALELQIINQQAAEIKKMEEAAPVHNRLDAISKAIGNYQSNVDRLKNRLEDIKETSQNPNIDNLLDKLVDRSLKHQQLFENLEKKFEARQEISEQERTELKEKFEANRERMNEIIAKIPEKFENIDRFNQRLENAIENRPEGVFKELRAIEALNRVKEKMPKEQQARIQELKDKMIDKFEIRMEGLDKNEQLRIFSSEVLENLPGDQIRRMGIFEEMKQGMRPEVRGMIEKAGEKILEHKIEKQEIRAEEVLRIIQEVKDLIAKAEEGAANNLVKQLLEKAKIHLSASEKAFAENKIGEAFGQAISAAAAAKNALFQIHREIQLNVLPGTSGIQREQINVCIQVITPAISLEGVCKKFPTPCDVPAGWKKVERCPEFLPPLLPSVFPSPSFDINQLPKTDLNR